VKRSWGRLGAAVGAVALVAGGLVGVAAPAQAAEYYVCDTRDIDNPTTGFCTMVTSGTYSLEDCTNALVNGVNRVFGLPNPSGLFWLGDVYQVSGATQCEASYTENAPPVDDDGVDDGDGGDSRDGGGGGAVTDLLESNEAYCDDENEASTTPDGFSEGAMNNICSEKRLLEPYAVKRWAKEGEDLQFYRITGRFLTDGSGDSEAEQVAPPPPPCWDASINNCPVGGALRFVAPKYAMVGVPVTMYAYASWRPDANSPAQPTNGTAVIRVDGEDYSGVEFKDGVAEWRFIP
jgi:hypothetical protein